MLTGASCGTTSNSNSNSHPEEAHIPDHHATSTGSNVDDTIDNVEEMIGNFTRDDNSCLFCPAMHQDEAQALEHMRIYHGFTIPNQDRLQTDVETFLSYVSLVINRFHACIFCGLEKRASDAVRTHMIAKGHCMLDMSPTSDFADFWETFEDTVGSVNLSDEELHLDSGTIISSRGRSHGLQTSRSNHRRPNDSNAMVVASSKSPRPRDVPASRSSHKSLVARDAAGLIGLSHLQRRSLAVTQKKIMAREQRYRNEARWTLEKLSNKVEQKHFKVSRACSAPHERRRRVYDADILVVA